MNRALSTWGPLVVLLALSACEPPGVHATSDRRQNTVLSRLEGQVVVSSAARGNVVVLLYDASRPPPPQGTGRPVSFTLIPQAEVFGAAAPGDLGPFTAPYAFSFVPPGAYTVRGFVDVAGDFIPWYSVTGEPNRGDVGGAAIEPSSRATRVLQVDATVPTLDVPVSFSDTALVPFDRPVFAANVPAVELTTQRGPAVITLTPRPLDEGPVKQGAPVFLAQFQDANQDGMADDLNGDGNPDLLWPKVFVRKLSAANPLLDENDLDRNGVLDATGADYEHVNPGTGATIAADGLPDAVVLAAGFDPSPIAAALVDTMGRPKPTPTPVNSLRLVIRPLALDARDPSAPAPLKQLPSGVYAVTVMQLSGQTWRVPNELAPNIAERLSLQPVDSQGFLIQVP